MTYVLFVYDRRDSVARPPEDRRQAIFGEYEALQALPNLAGHRLEPAAEAVTVRVVGGRRTLAPEPVGDEPPLAGFYLLDTDDREHALDVAARIPAARLGGAVEVRRLMSDP